MHTPRQTERALNWLAHLFRFLRYGAVAITISLLYSGLVITSIDIFGFQSPTLASVFAFLLILPLSFFSHQRVSFRDSTPDRRQPFRFAVIAGTSFTFAVGGMHLMTEVLKLHYLFGVAAVWILVPATNFLINSIFVFPLSQTNKTAKAKIFVDPYGRIAADGKRRSSRK
jgi:putative flippase GtrA